MKNKIVGILIITLFMVTAIFPASALSTTVNEKLYEQEEAELSDITAVSVFVVALLNGYQDLGEYWEMDFKIGFWFVIGVDYGQFLFGPALLYGVSPVVKGTFLGTLTQSHMIGCLIVT